jgi:hypothetical protein
MNSHIETLNSAARESVSLSATKWGRGLGRGGAQGSGGEACSAFSVGSSMFDVPRFMERKKGSEMNGTEIKFRIFELCCLRLLLFNFSRFSLL